MASCGVKELGLSLVQVGTVWGATFAAGIFVLFFAGLLSDRFGVRQTLAIACLLTGVFGALRGLSDSFAPIYPGLPFAFRAGLAVVSSLSFLFVAETGSHKKQSYAIEY
jgi:MFS family permease